MNLELTNEEHALLAEIVRYAYQDLREEVVHTEAYRFKEGLKAREHLMEGLLDKLEMPPAE
jgi:hypothetical protein